MVRGVPSEPLLSRDRSGIPPSRSRQVLLLCGCLAATCCLSLLVSLDGAAPKHRTAFELMSAAVAADSRVAEISREASLVKTQNAKLQREDEMMEAEKSVLERSLLEKQKAAKLNVERKR